MNSLDLDNYSLSYSNSLKYFSSDSLSLFSANYNFSLTTARSFSRSVILFELDASFSLACFFKALNFISTAVFSSYKDYVFSLNSLSHSLFAVLSLSSNLPYPLSNCFSSSLTFLLKNSFY